ncbi:nucleotidyltransferase domain-containing protein [Microbacterium aurum]
MEHHDRALAAYVDDVRGDEDVVAVIAVGSVARGSARPDSDVDVYLVVEDGRFTAEASRGRFAWVDRRGLDYPGSYIDVKLASPTYLTAAAERADDATRASFLGARVAYTRIARLDELITRIADVPAGDWDGRVASYLSQARLYGGYFLRQAASSGDEFLLRHAAVHLAHAAARAALATDRMLMRGPKYISESLRTSSAPVSFLVAWDQLVARPSPESAAALLYELDVWLGTEPAGDEALSDFIRDNELAWLRRTVPPEYW